MRRKPFGLFHFSYSCGDERGGNHWWWRILWPSLYGQNSFSLIWNVQTLNQRHDRSSIGCSTESVSDIASKIISKIIYIFRRILIYNTCVLDGVLKMEFLLVHYMELSEKCVAEMKFSTYWHKVLSNARKVHGKYDFYRRWITLSGNCIFQMVRKSVKEIRLSLLANYSLDQSKKRMRTLTSFCNFGINLWVFGKGNRQGFICYPSPWLNLI